MKRLRMIAAIIRGLFHMTDRELFQTRYYVQRVNSYRGLM